MLTALRSPLSFTLVQILRASGDAFPQTAEVIIPFIQPEDPRQQETTRISRRLRSKSNGRSCEKMLDLIAAVVRDSPARTVYGLTKVLDRIREHSPRLASLKKFQRLVSLASARWLVWDQAEGPGPMPGTRTRPIVTAPPPTRGCRPIITHVLREPETVKQTVAPARGATASGTGDRFATPFDRVTPGVEIFATANSNLLAGDGWPGRGELAGVELVECRVPRLAVARPLAVQMRLRPQLEAFRGDGS
jgi:CHASE2 domain